MHGASHCFLLNIDARVRSTVLAVLSSIRTTFKLSVDQAVDLKLCPSPSFVLEVAHDWEPIRRIERAPIL